MNQLYVVLTWVPRRQVVPVGSLGPVAFDRGWYAYVGSAERAREARVSRHLSAEKSLRWHADYLFGAAPAQRAWLVDTPLMECDLAASLAASPGGSQQPPRFGSGDCSCPGHLVHLRRRLLRSDLRLAAGDGAAAKSFVRRRPA